ncbi:MAG: NifU family protein [Schleiferiaceae bacterium]|jgi:Fe-S cluster biogenesis protein NfuA|nr:NifU family protein [Schleiferiaceae bacterium]
MTRGQMESEILRALAEIRPFLNNDGGDISFMELTDDNVVKVKLHGACNGCSVNQMTLKSGVEMTIKKYIPEIKEVVQID